MPDAVSFGQLKSFLNAAHKDKPAGPSPQGGPSPTLQMPRSSKPLGFDFLGKHTGHMDVALSVLFGVCDDTETDGAAPLKMRTSQALFFASIATTAAVKAIALQMEQAQRHGADLATLSALEHDLHSAVAASACMSSLASIQVKATLVQHRITLEDLRAGRPDDVQLGRCFVTEALLDHLGFDPQEGLRRVGAHIRTVVVQAYSDEPGIHP